MSHPIRVAEYIAQRVRREGTDAFFTLSGVMMIHLLDAFGRTPGMRYYCNHHEQASAMGADGYARESGKLGVCLATSGPGATNLLTGIVGAYHDSIPVLFLTGQCKLKETARWRGITGLRQSAFLEVDIIPIVSSVTKYAAFIDNPRDIRVHLEKAIHLATTGRPGPVLLDIPQDLQASLIKPEELPGYTPEHHDKSVSDDDLECVVANVRNAHRPLILAGHGVRSAGEVQQFQRLVEKWRVPVVTTLMAKDILPDNHPLFVGHPGPRAHRGANYAVQSADVILCIGCSLQSQTVGHDGSLFAKNALKIQIDLDRAVLQRENAGVNMKFAWDIRDYLPMMIEKVNQVWSGEGADEWRDTCRRWKNNYSSRNENHHLGKDSDPVNLYEFVDMLSDVMDDEESILTDAGQPHPILGQALRLKPGQRYINPGSFAGMGYALPSAIGVAVANPHKNVIAVIGDGSLQTNIQELQTLVHHGFNVKLFVINNDGYASIRNHQKSLFNGYFVASTPSSGVTLPDTLKICDAYGLPYECCPNRGALFETLHRVLRRSGPVVCEIIAQTDQCTLPVVPSQLMPDGTIRHNPLHEMAPEVPANPPLSKSYI